MEVRKLQRVKNSDAKVDEYKKWKKKKKSGIETLQGTERQLVEGLNSYESIPKIKPRQSAHGKKVSALRNLPDYNHSAAPKARYDNAALMKSNFPSYASRGVDFNVSNGPLPSYTKWAPRERHELRESIRDNARQEVIDSFNTAKRSQSLYKGYIEDSEKKNKKPWKKLKIKT